MAETATPEETPKKGGILPLAIGAVLAVVAGGGGYLVTGSGLLAKQEKKPEVSKPSEKVSFIPLDPLTISLSGSGSSRHLRFEAQLEVVADAERAVREKLPRVNDVLNGYLRAVSPSEFEDPAALVRIRAQMLRRVQIIVGDGLVGDLLVMEFVLS